MIRFNLKKLLAKLEKETGRKILLKEVAEQSGCDKNALSRMINHPEIIPSATVIDKLVQFFFFAMKEKYDRMFTTRSVNSKWIMESIIRDFIVVFPDRADFWEILPPEVKNTTEPLSLDAIWSIYDRLHNPNAELPASRIKPTTILDAMQPIQVEEDGQYTISFTLPKEHYEFVLNRLPEMIEALFPEPNIDAPVKSAPIKNA